MEEKGSEIKLAIHSTIQFLKVAKMCDVICKMPTTFVHYLVIRERNFDGPFGLFDVRAHAAVGV